MKTIKKMLLLAMCFLVLPTFTSAQVTTTVTNPIKESPFQFSTRVGYDFPNYGENFKYIDYQGGVMGGLSANYYFPSNFGLQMDFDYISNSPKISSSLYDILIQGAGLPQKLSEVYDIKETYRKISRMFVGIGPAWRSLNEKRNFQFEASLLGGIGTINGGAILATVNHRTFPVDPAIPLTYHSGFDNLTLLTGKAQVRATYFFNNNWGVNAGAYYMKYFSKLEESQKNTLLDAYSIPDGSGVYYIEPELFSTTIDTQDGMQEVEIWDGEMVTREFDKQETDEMRKMDLSSFGVFVGVTYRLFSQKKEKKSQPVVEKKEKLEEKYCTQITAKDKISGEIIPNTDVALKNTLGDVIKTAKTNAFGIVEFCELDAADYKVEGVYNEINLEPTAINKNEFVVGEKLKKDILYTDRNFIVKGRAFECNSTTPISGITIVLENTSKNFKKTTYTDTDGKFLMQLPENGQFDLYGKKDSYFSQIEKVDATNYDRNKSLFVKLEICSEKVDCGKAIGLKNILFDLDKSFIRDDAKPELNKLVRFMTDNPTVQVEIGSHTDSRGSAAYNKKLSQSRATSSANYIISQGIAASRIVGTGFGESQLLNNCSDGVDCPETAHQLNRRTEFKVICNE